MLLVFTISEASFQHVQEKTSRELWLSLKRAYAPHTSSKEYTLKTQLLRLEMKADETSSAYLTRAQVYADALANIGEPMKEKDLVMLVISVDHDKKKDSTYISPAQAFTADIHQPPSATSSTTAVVVVYQPDHLQAIKQLLSQLGLQVQSSNTAAPAQAMFTNRLANNRGRGRGRGNYHNRNQGGNRSQFSWASNENIVYGTCDRRGIGHLPSDSPNRDPTTIRRQPPSVNFATHRSQASFSWLPDMGSSHHVAAYLSNFDHFEAYYGDDNLDVGNGSYTCYFI
ncbi:uncharacterized protein [Rutidosis leptorrhynchoides]|uniref:uncharacterized protein n=1 Tax=Rutidosis leptorrhynchoides TaxID=125765 RepID=UPI003A98D262